MLSKCQHLCASKIWPVRVLFCYALRQKYCVATQVIRVPRAVAMAPMSRKKSCFLFRVEMGFSIIGELLKCIFVVFHCFCMMRDCLKITWGTSPWIYNRRNLKTIQKFHYVVCVCVCVCWLEISRKMLGSAFTILWKKTMGTNITISLWSLSDCHLTVYGTDRSCICLRRPCLDFKGHSLGLGYNQAQHQILKPITMPVIYTIEGNKFKHFQFYI